MRSADVIRVTTVCYPVDSRADRFLVPRLWFKLCPCWSCFHRNMGIASFPDLSKLANAGLSRTGCFINGGCHCGVIIEVHGRVDHLSPHVLYRQPMNMNGHGMLGRTNVQEVDWH